MTEPNTRQADIYHTVGDRRILLGADPSSGRPAVFRSEFYTSPDEWDGRPRWYPAGTETFATSAEAEAFADRYLAGREPR